MNKVGGVYEILNTESGKRYIGQSVAANRRWTQHKWYLRRGAHHCAPLQRAWVKHGPFAFVFTLLFECEPHELTKYEQAAIDYFAPEYNVAPVAGSCAGMVRPEISARMVGNKYSLGFRHAPETIEKCRLATLGRKQRPESVAKSAAARTGQKRSAEARERMRLAHLGKKRSAESIAKQALALVGNKHSLGYRHTPEAKAKISAAGRLRHATAIT